MHYGRPHLRSATGRRALRGSVRAFTLSRSRPPGPLRLWLALGLAAFAGCASSPPVQFFTLDPVAGQRLPAPAPLMPVKVTAVHVPPALDRREMVRHSAPNRLRISDEHRWGADFDEMARRVLTQDLAQRLPKGTVVLPRQPTPAHTRAIVVDMLQFSANASGTVVLDGGWSLWTADSDTPVLNRPIHLSVEAAPGDYSAQAHAMSELLGRLADAIAAQLAAPAR